MATSKGFRRSSETSTAAEACLPASMLLSVSSASGGAIVTKLIRERSTAKRGANDGVGERCANIEGLRVTRVSTLSRNTLDTGRCASVCVVRSVTPRLSENNRGRAGLWLRSW
eukprot:3574517-Prymnesium_polylepis.1